MGLYNMIFGTNPASAVILATLGLRPSDVGRFRDCFISEGEIAVYTRNGGGNRQCWHEESPESGDDRCKHHTIEKEVDVYEQVEGQYVAVLTANVIGRKVETLYVCEHPNSEECGCPGCIINYRLPKHPLYLRDKDDDFDTTYATVYFKFPDEFADDLRKLDSGKKFDPDERWQKVIDAMKTRE